MDLDGYVDTTETRSVQSDGSVLDVVADLDPNGGSDRIVRTTSANGLSSSLSADVNGDGTNDHTQSKVTVLNADGSATSTFSDAYTDPYPNSSDLADMIHVVTTTSADGLSKSSTFSGYNQGFGEDYAETDVTVLNADGSRQETITDSGTDPGYLGTYNSEIITVGVHDLTSSVQIDLDGNGTYDIIDGKALNADGSTTETLTQLNEDGSLYQKDITTTSANGRTVSLQRDSDGDGVADHFETTSVNADGSKTDTVYDQTAAGALAGKTITSVSANGFDTTIQIDADGTGSIDQTEIQATALNADGSRSSTRSDLNANGTLRDQTSITTSANGLVETGTIDLDGDGATDETYSNATVLNADGSRTATVQTSYADGSLKSRSVTTTSMDGGYIVTAIDLNGDGATDLSDASYINDAGQKTETVDYLNADGSLKASDVTTTSADGRIVSTARDFNGDGQLDVLETTMLTADGYGSYDTIAPGLRVRSGRRQPCHRRHRHG